MSKTLDRTINVGMGQAAFSNGQEALLVIHGLGSCIALALYDPVTRQSGLCHIVLPEGDPQRDGEPPAKYANTAVPWVLAELCRLGAKPGRIMAKIAGGAKLFATISTPALNIGERNTEAVQAALTAAGIPLLAQDVGGVQGRGITFHPADGRLEVKRVGTSPLIL